MHMQLMVHIEPLTLQIALGIVSAFIGAAYYLGQRAAREYAKSK